MKITHLNISYEKGECRSQGGSLGNIPSASVWSRGSALERPGVKCNREKTASHHLEFWACRAGVDQARLDKGLDPLNH